MQELLESIRAAIAEGATSEQKAAGAEACRTIQAALGASTGQTLVPPGVPLPAASPLAGIDIGQALDLVIARLSAALPPQSTPAVPKNRGLQFAFVHPRRK
jgi:hypothetical protein